MYHLLIIEDDVEVTNFLQYLFEERGLYVSIGHNKEDFQNLIQEKVYQLAFLDIKLPDANGLDLLKVLREKMPYCKTIVMTGYSTVQTAISAIKIGADDYIEKPFDDISELEELVDGLLQSKPNKTEGQMHELAKNTGLVIGKSEAMINMVKFAFKIAKKNINVLIEGETGTGKEVFAQFIHLASLRSDQPFIGVNCSTLSESLLESELFGHVKGAFTSAVKDRKGIFELATKGTLFLDEIAEALPTTQAKLLRVLETGEFMKVGAEAVQRTNSRVIAATNVNLEAAVKRKRFREDLWYRLDVVRLTLPPLRERKEDIPYLLDYMLTNLQSSLRFSEASLKLILNYDWPGNVRELFNCVKRAVTLADSHTTSLSPEYLPKRITVHTLINDNDEDRLQKEDSFKRYIEQWRDNILTLWESGEEIDLESVLNEIREVERIIGQSFVKKSLQKTMGNRKEAAERLNISIRKLRYLLKEKGQSD